MCAYQPRLIFLLRINVRAEVLMVSNRLTYLVMKMFTLSKSFIGMRHQA